MNDYEFDIKIEEFLYQHRKAGAPSRDHAFSPVPHPSMVNGDVLSDDPSVVTEALLKSLVPNP